jgi:steroid delta-isomerase-like uncharacterized protein
MDQLPAVVHGYIEAYNRKDVSRMLSCFADDVVFENVSNGAVTMRTEGKEALGALAQQAAQAFVERRQTVKSLVASDHGVALEIVYDAVVALDLPNGWKAGQSIHLRGASFFRLRDGLIAELIDIS